MKKTITENPIITKYLLEPKFENKKFEIEVKDVRGKNFSKAEGANEITLNRLQEGNEIFMVFHSKVVDEPPYRTISGMDAQTFNTSEYGKIALTIESSGMIRSKYDANGKPLGLLV